MIVSATAGGSGEWSRREQQGRRSFHRARVRSSHRMLLALLLWKVSSSGKLQAPWPCSSYLLSFLRYCIVATDSECQEYDIDAHTYRNSCKDTKKAATFPFNSEKKSTDFVEYTVKAELEGRKEDTVTVTPLTRRGACRS